MTSAVSSASISSEPDDIPTTSLSTTNRRGRATRERVLAAAVGELARRGLDLTIDDVARSASTTRMTVYRHFGTREDLLTTLLVQEATLRLAELRPVLESDAPFAERLTDAIVYVVSTVRTSPHLRAIVARSNPGEAWPQVDPGGRFVALLWSGLLPYMQAANAEVRFRTDVDHTLDWLLRQVLGLLLVEGRDGSGEAAIRADVATFVIPSIIEG